jgi:hypothetical protein
MAGPTRAQLRAALYATLSEHGEVDANALLAVVRGIYPGAPVDTKVAGEVLSELVDQGFAERIESPGPYRFRIRGL